MAFFDAAGAALRPVLKTVMKGGVIAYDYGRQAMSGMAEVFEEARAEARAHSQEKQPQQKVSPTPQPSAQTPPVNTIPEGEPAA